MSECLIYIDNSNLFIEGQKFLARKLELRVSQDPRFRYENGKLQKALANKRSILETNLYGSEPPPLDTVWKAMEKVNIRVETSERNLKGEEKEVDVSMAVDIMEQVVLNKDKKTLPIIIMVTGDRDLIQAVKKAVAYNYSVEIISFKSSLSKKYIEMEKQQKIKIIFMESILNEFNAYFTNYQGTYLERKRKIYIRKDKAFAIVFNKSFTLSPKLCKPLTEKITSILKFPCIFWINDKCINEMFVEILEINNDAFTNILQKNHEVLKEIAGSKCIKIISLVAYLNPLPEEYDILDTDPPDSEDEDDANFEQKDKETQGAEAFQPVQQKMRHYYQKYSSKCKHGFRCSKGFRCAYNHDDNEKEFFKVNYGRGFWNYKAMPCNHFNPYDLAKSQPCRYSKQSFMCRFAHGIEEARCYTCNHHSNHFAMDCLENK